MVGICSGCGDGEEGMPAGKGMELNSHQLNVRVQEMEASRMTTQGSDLGGCLIQKIKR